MVLLMAGVQASWGFALLGPQGNGGDSWQTATIGYGLAYTDESTPITPGGPVFLGDIGGPKNLGEEYRRNIPVLYYAYDASFLDFFGSNGVAAVDSAFGIMNSITNVDSPGNDISNYPLNSQAFNYDAQSLYLTDLKSATLHVLLEQMGLAEPERFSWTLAERLVPPGCPLTTLYLVVQRNFSDTPTPFNQIQYSSYVNNVLYTYAIQEFCTGPNPLAYTVPFASDPETEEYTSVAANNGDGFGGLQFGAGGGLQLGGYYTGLTQDDVAGLRYLLSTNTMKWEAVAPDNLLITSITNFSEQDLFPVATGTNNGYLYNGVLYGTGSLQALLSFASTNNAAAVQAQFPGVQVTQVSNYFTNIWVTNVVSYFTNGLSSPTGEPYIVSITNVSLGFIQFYVDTFPNIITNSYSSNTVYWLQTVTVGPQNGAPITSPSVTNTVTTQVTAKTPSGDFYILPTNGPCGVDILYTLLTFTNYTTNIITSAITTNSTGTNVILASEQLQIFPSISHIFVINPINCLETPGATNIYPGLEGIKFVRADFDSLVGQYWQPITNNYARYMVTNSQMVLQHFQRVATQPDFLLDASDFIGANTFNGTVVRNINFDQSTVPAGLAGPGVINSPTTISYNKVGDAFRNGPLASYPTAVFLSQLTQYPTAAWGSFDGTTNPPTVYPNGNSIQNLANEILIHVSPTTVPNGTNNMVYLQSGTNVTFTATGGAFTPPFTWSATGLPAGLSVNTDTMVDPNGDGVLSGTPSQSGTFDFNLQLTDTLGRRVQWFYTIIIQ